MIIEEKNYLYKLLCIFFFSIRNVLHLEYEENKSAKKIDKDKLGADLHVALAA